MSETPDQLTLFAEDSPAKTSVSLASVREWQESAADSGGNSIASLVNANPVGSLSKMSLGFFPRTKERICFTSSSRWRSWGTGGPTGFLTANISESPNDGVESLLSDILEHRVHQKYFLSAKACSGILRRAGDRGKALPKALETALKEVVSAGTNATTKTAE